MSKKNKNDNNEKNFRIRKNNSKVLRWVNSKSNKEEKIDLPKEDLKVDRNNIILLKGKDNKVNDAESKKSFLSRYSFTKTKFTLAIFGIFFASISVISPIIVTPILMISNSSFVKKNIVSSLTQAQTIYDNLNNQVIIYLTGTNLSLDVSLYNVVNTVNNSLVNITSVYKDGDYFCLSFVDTNAASAIYTINFNNDVSIKTNKSILMPKLEFINQPSNLVIEPRNTGIFIFNNSDIAIANQITGQTLTYQWYEVLDTSSSTVGTPLVGENKNSLSITGLDSIGNYEKYYYCEVGYIYAKPIRSKTFSLTVRATPIISISSQPQNLIVSPGDVATFNLAANVTNPITGQIASFQWYELTTNSTTAIGTPIPGATTNTLTVTDTLSLANLVKFYYCEITYIYATTLRSNTVSLSVNPVPVLAISTQPTNQTIPKGGSSATFNIAANISNPISGQTISYQWYESTNSLPTTIGTPLVGQTSNSLTINSQISYEGTVKYYYCEVSYLYAATVRSNTVSLTTELNPVISISAQPTNKLVSPGTSVSFVVNANVANPISGQSLAYQWYSNTTNSNVGGTLISGQTTNTLNFTDTLGMAGLTQYYYCEITYLYAPKVVSNVAQLIVNGLPAISISTQPTNATVEPTKTASFSVSASVSNILSGQVLNYQWYSNTTNSTSGATLISGATSNTLTISSSDTLALAGARKYYFCKLSYQYAADVYSSIATLTVNPLPLITITSQPTNQVTLQGLSSSFTVSASVNNQITGNSISYQWYQASSLTDTTGTILAGQVSNTLNINTTTSDAVGSIRYYFCQITYGNSSNNNLKTNIVSLTVNPKPTISVTTQPSNVTLDPGNIATFNVDSSIVNPYGVANTTYQWYSNTTNSSTGGTLLAGQTNKSLIVSDTAALKGTSKYYYCEISYPNADNVKTNVATLSVNGSYTQASANQALDTFLASESNQLQIVTSYFSDSTRAKNFFKNDGALGYIWSTAPDVSFTRATFVNPSTDTTIPKTWLVELTTTTVSGFYNFVGGGYESTPTTIPIGSKISFYLPFSFVQNVAMNNGNESFTMNLTKSVTSGSTSLSWSLSTATNPILPSIYKFKVTNASNVEIFTTWFQIFSNIIVNFNNTTSNLPTYTFP